MQHETEPSTLAINLVLLFAAARASAATRRSDAAPRTRAHGRRRSSASDRILIDPRAATSNVAKLGEEAQAAVAAGADCLHFNVMA